MTNIFKAAAAVAAVVVASSWSAPAVRADSFSIGIGSGGVGFSYESGGYCDRWGCPDEYWDYPIYECPIYYGGEWYRGPVYYRRSFGSTYYWVHGGWRRDEWRGPRPGWACMDRFRPAPGFLWYENNGFRIRDDWRRRWHESHDRGWDRNRGWDDRGRDRFRDGDRDHNRDRDQDRDRFRDRNGQDHGRSDNNWNGGNRNGFTGDRSGNHNWSGAAPGSVQPSPGGQPTGGRFGGDHSGSHNWSGAAPGGVQPTQPSGNQPAGGRNWSGGDRGGHNWSGGAAAPGGVQPSQPSQPTGGRTWSGGDRGGDHGGNHGQDRAVPNKD